MECNIRQGKNWVSVIGATNVEKIMGAITAARQGYVVTVWSADPADVCKTLVSAGLKAAVTGEGDKVHVAINSRAVTATSKEQDQSDLQAAFKNLGIRPAL